MKVKIKARGNEAKELLGMTTNDKPAGKPLMQENPASRQAEGASAGPSHGMDYMDKGLPVVTAENVEMGYDIVKPVKSEVPAQYPEVARRKNNMARDMRTNLGRGKAGIVDVE